VALLDLFKLEKLRIDGFTDEERTTPAAPPSMAVMFNPTTFKRTQSLAYSKTSRMVLNAPSSPAEYANTQPSELSFQIVLDGTGVAFMGAEQIARTLSRRSVKNDIAMFETLCLKMNSATHEPNFLTIRWGSHLDFPGRLQSYEVAFKLFDEGGDPLRAELDVSFIEDVPVEKGARLAGKSSPDLTHVRVVKSGDTLPLLCKEIYGSSAYYLRVAADNGLDDFRSLTPGQTLRFSPLPGSSGARTPATGRPGGV
jgi:Uncharacterized protein containing LysM domain